MYDTKLNDAANDIVRWRKKKGFKTPSSINEHEAVLAKLMLVVTEIGEAAEAVRHHDDANFNEEIADTFIRLLDLTGTMGIDIEAEIAKKMAINEGRELRHGKQA